jgi:branched-chain amino acid transport system substrate-binding protein
MSRSRQRTAGYVKWGIAGLACTVAAACASAGSGAAGSGAAGAGAIPVAALLPISGSLANFGERTADGVKLGVDEVNAHGGVMGRPLNLSLGDDGGDAVDAVPAFRQLETHNPVALFGPVSPTFPAVQQLIEAAHIPTFAIIANVPYDKLQNPYVFHAVVSDSLTGAAMAAFALKKGYTHAAVLFASDASSQTLSGVVASAYKGHGGTLATDVSVSPDQSTYSTELAKLFATHPDAVFIQADAQTSGTIFADARQLGFDKTPWIGSDEYTSIEEAKAIGLGTAS